MMELRLPTFADEKQLRAAYAELELEGHDGFLLDGFQDDPEDFAGWLERVNNQYLGKNIPDGRVASTFLIALFDNKVVGRISIRHELNEFLRSFGGHIGYMVRPGFRGQGYASQMLRAGLLVAKQQGIDSALLTCNDTNLGSIRVIESNGGRLENIVDKDGELLRRYWIDTKGSSSAVDEY